MNTHFNHANALLEDLNPAQRATLDHIIDQLTTRKGSVKEIKRLEIYSSIGGRFFVRLETGMPGDEGTMAEIFVRDYRHLHLGVRGGVTLLNGRPKRGKNSRRVSGVWNAIWSLTH